MGSDDYDVDIRHCEFLAGSRGKLAGLGTPAFGAPWLYLTYGLIGGVGAGMAYVAPLAMVAKWFPDRRGLAGGLVAGGFGLGAFIYNQCIPRLAGFHAAAVMHVFIGSGSAYLLIGLPAAALFRDPPTEYRVAGRGTTAQVAAITGYPPSRVLTMPQFYLLWLQLFGNIVVGITIISGEPFPTASAATGHLPLCSPSRRRHCCC